MRNGTWKELLRMNGAEDWFMALAFAIGGWLLGQLVLRISHGLLGRWAARTTSGTDDLLLRDLRSPLVLIITVLGLFLGYQHLNWPEKADLWMARVLHVAVAASFTWLIARTVTRLLGEYLHRGRAAEERHGSAIPALTGVVNVLIWGLGMVVALSNAGYDVGALLAGIGIGGLAMAMAAKDTLANIFGGITVFADKPFKIGDRVVLDDFDGTVMEVGMRSTRIRTLDGAIVVIPNQKFTESVLTNITAGTSRRIRHEFGLEYSTSPEKLREAIAILEGIVSAHPDLLTPEHVASFTTFGDYSLIILFVYHIRQGRDIGPIQTRIHLEVLERFTAAGLSFAFPTSVELQGRLPQSGAKEGT